MLVEYGFHHVPMLQKHSKTLSDSVCFSSQSLPIGAGTRREAGTGEIVVRVREGLGSAGWVEWGRKGQLWGMGEWIGPGGGWRDQQHHLPSQI